MTVTKNLIDTTKFNCDLQLPYELRLADFQMAMQDVYDFFYDVNSLLARKGSRSRQLERKGVPSIHTARETSGCAYLCMALTRKRNPHQIDDR